MKKDKITTWDDLEKELKTNDEDEQAFQLIAEIVKRRVELGLSQRDLEKLSGIKQSAIARMESFRSIPTLDTLIKVIKPLKLKIKLVEDN